MIITKKDKPAWKSEIWSSESLLPRILAFQEILMGKNMVIQFISVAEEFDL